MTREDLSILGLTLGCAALAVLAILLPGLALAWLLARRGWPGKALVETVVALPLVLPPVAIGLILLQLLGRRGPFGAWLQAWGVPIVFTWRAVVIAAGVMAFPLFVRTARVAFETVEPRLEQIARTLGASEWRVWWTITLPLAARGILAGTLLAFGRALGEFGATVMLAGNIPGRTSTLSLAIYNLVQLGDDKQAWRYLGFLVAIVLAVIALGEWLQRSGRRL